MNETIKLSELIQWINDGAYIGGEVFVNELGQELYYDGQSLVGIEKVPLNSQFTYVGTKKVAS